MMGKIINIKIEEIIYYKDKIFYDNIYSMIGFFLFHFIFFHFIILIYVVSAFI